MALPTFTTPGYNPNAPTSQGTKPRFPDAPTTPVPTSKPGNMGQSTELQQHAQAGLPFSPNNGNPRGAHNTSPWRGSVPGLRSSRTGGGYIGAAPPTGARLGQDGAYFGRGALTPVQQQRNQEAIQAENMRQRSIGSGYNPAQLAAQMGAALRQYRGGLPAPPGLNNGMNAAQPGFDMAQYSQNPQGPVAGYPMPQQPIYRGGQDPRLGRYRPPQMVNGDWQNNGGYSYNLPNPFGPYPRFGQGAYGYGGDTSFGLAPEY